MGPGGLVDVVTIRVDTEQGGIRQGRLLVTQHQGQGGASAYSPIHWRKKSYKSGALGSITEREAWSNGDWGIPGGCLEIYRVGTSPAQT